MKSPSISLRDEVCHADNLAAAFRHHQHRRGLWACGIPMQQVARYPVGPMLALADELRRGTFRPSPPRSFVVAKGDGGLRELKIYPLRERVAQRALLQVLQGHIDPAMAPGSFAFRPGRGVVHAVDAVRRWLDLGFGWVLGADVERCFDSIPRRSVLAEVERRAGDSAAAELVAEVMGWRDDTTLDTLGLPQGATLAPLLCNVHLWRLDDACRDARLPMVRYADDFVVLSLARRIAETALAVCREALASLGLHLHPGKTRLFRATRPFTFLGRPVGPTPRLAAPESFPNRVLPCC